MIQTQQTTTAVPAAALLQQTIPSSGRRCTAANCGLRLFT